jgi:high-affinity iron transporter
VAGRITHRRSLAVAGGAVVLVCVVVAAWALAGGSGATGAPATAPITVSGYNCAPGWTLPPSGQHQLTVVNSGSSVVDVTLVGASNSLVFGEIDAMGPGVTRTLTVVIPPGRYRIRCSYSENASILSSAVTVTGPPVSGAHPYLPVTYNQMAPAVTAYRNSVSVGLVTLAAATDQLHSLAQSGSGAATKAAWLVAHLDYERLGAAYGAFGNFADEIDGRPNGLPLGVDDPGWTGFLRLEYALWHDQPQPIVATVADTLDQDVHGLVAAFPDQTIEANDLSLRTHEILENTLQFQLTGQSDQGGHTTLATALANVSGTQLTLGAIAPVLAPRDPALLASATTDLHRLASLLATYRHPDGTWAPLQSLSRSQRQILDAAMGTYLETVSPVPDILELQPEAQNP